MHNELAHRDLVHKDTDERFREALQKLRQDRAEQQNKDIVRRNKKEFLFKFVRFFIRMKKQLNV